MTFGKQNFPWILKITVCPVCGDYKKTGKLFCYRDHEISERCKQIVAEYEQHVKEAKATTS